MQSTERFVSGHGVRVQRGDGVTNRVALFGFLSQEIEPLLECALYPEGTSRPTLLRFELVQIALRAPLASKSPSRFVTRIG